MEINILEPHMVRPPEMEVYGRSLRAARKLGAFVINTFKSEIINSPEAEQARIEFDTSIDEGLGTDPEIGNGLEVRDFDHRPVVDRKVMAKDLSTAMVSITESGLICAEKRDKTDPYFRPQLTRTIHDHNNAVENDKMVRGETGYNTRLLVTPYPEEAALISGDEYWGNIGYVPKYRRGFVQLYFADGEGLLCGSLSFDGSDKHRIREEMAKIGVIISEDEVTDNYLSYVATATLTEEQARELSIDLANALTDDKYKKNTNTVDLTGKNKELRDRVFNESYIPMCESLALGHQTNETISLVHTLANQAHHFNDRYRKALYQLRADSTKFTSEDAIIIHELLVYSTIEMMRAIYTERALYVSDEDIRSIGANYISQIDINQLQNMLSNFGVEGARNNRTFSACGLSISLGGNKDNSGPQSAYGGADKISDSESSDNSECVYVGPYCYCCPYDSTGEKLPTLIETTIKRGKDGVAKCLRAGCGATLDKNGNGSKGRIYEKAMLLLRQKQKVKVTT